MNSNIGGIGNRVFSNIVISNHIFGNIYFVNNKNLIGLVDDQGVSYIYLCDVNGLDLFDVENKQLAATGTVAGRGVYIK